jgi:CheY-like chemotaxis protein
VLVVEDHPVNQTIIRAMLARMGCAIEMADNGVQALRAFEKNTYDLVLMDCQMPEMDGFDTTRAIREREALNPTMGRVPVIALTALAMLGDAERCLAAGMDDYLTKPIQLEQLSATNQEHCFIGLEFVEGADHLHAFTRQHRAAQDDIPPPWQRTPDRLKGLPPHQDRMA